jgi:hypothetical protein
VDVLQQQHTLAPLPDISATSGTKTAGAIAGNAGAVGNISYVSAPGVLAVSADAFASVGGRTVPTSIKDDVAAAQATVLAEIIDQWIFKSDTPVKRVHVNASFRLAGDLTTTAEGVNATPAKFNQDRIDARGSAIVRFSGSGIQAATCCGAGDIRGLSLDDIEGQTIPPTLG